MHLTPGRSAMVWFFPHKSYEILIEKPQKWGRNTNYGRDNGEGQDQVKELHAREANREQRLKRI